MVQFIDSVSYLMLYGIHKLLFINNINLTNKKQNEKKIRCKRVG